MNRQCLRPNVQVEPLVDGWYAWSQLIPPATFARQITQRHIKIMESYIAAPQVHASAVKNPKMLGGPFMDFPGTRVVEVQGLLAETLDKRAKLIHLSRALEELDLLLQSKAKGESLSTLYLEVPQALKGYVELMYDLNNHPSYRLIEPLLYKSEYYDETAQSISLREISSDVRPFVLSTPRLPQSEILNISIPFASEGLNRLFKSLRSPDSVSELAEICEIPQGSMVAFNDLFTDKMPGPYQRYEGPGLRWRYFGHACILVESRDTTILFDPVLSYTYESSVHRYTYEDLPEVIDYVVVTHNHQDHVLLETLLQLRHKIGSIIVPRNNGGALQDPSLKQSLRHAGFKDVRDLEELDSIEFEGGRLVGIPFMGEHSDLAILSKLAYLVEFKGHKILFAADSCNIAPELYYRIRECVGRIDVLFVGMECDGAPLSWLYGPLFSHPIERRKDESRRLSGCNFKQAFDMVEVLGCREVYVYAMGQEPWLKYIMSIEYTPESNPIVQSDMLINACLDRGLKAERLFGEREICVNIS